MNRQSSIALRWVLLQALLLGCSARGFVDAPEAGASHPFARHALPKAARHWISGRVEERVLAGNYVYLRIREPSGSTSWLVSLKVTTPEAQEVRALVVGRAAHFHSRQLDRDFTPLLFAAVRSVAN